MGCEFNAIEYLTPKSNQSRNVGGDHPTPPGSKSSETEIFLPSPDKDLNMEFLLKAMANF